MPDKIAEYRRQQIPEYSLDKLQIENAFQAAYSSKDASSQTTYARMLNKATQYHPLTAPPEVCRQELERFVSTGALSRAAALVEEALLANETLDPLVDPLEQLAQYSGGLGHRVESLLRPVHTLQYTPPVDKHMPAFSSRNRALTCVAWHPTLPGIVAFVCADLVPEDARMKGCHVIVWDLAELLRPRAILQAPDTVTCLCWAPAREGVLVCGMATGQLCAFELQGAVVGTFAVLLGLRDGETKFPAVTSASDKKDEKGNPVKPATPSTLNASNLFGLLAAVEKDDIGEASAAELGLAYRHIRRPTLCPALPHPLAITSASEAAARANSNGALGDDLPVVNAAAADPHAQRAVGREDEASDTSLLPQLPVCVSAAERSHSSAVAAIRGLPADIDMNRKAELLRPREYGAVRGSVLISVGSDAKVLYWDVDELLYRPVIEEDEAAAKAEAEVEERERERAIEAAKNPVATPEDEPSKPSWRQRFSSRNATATASAAPTEEAAAAPPAEEDGFAMALASAAAANTAQVSRALDAIYTQWRPFQQQQLIAPGGKMLRAISLSVGEDLIMCVGGSGGEVAVGAYAFSTGKEEGAAGGLGNGLNTPMSVNSSVSADIVGMYGGDKSIFLPQVPVGKGKHALPSGSRDRSSESNTTSKSNHHVDDRQLLLSLNGGVDSASEDEDEAYGPRASKSAAGEGRPSGNAGGMGKSGEDDGYSGVKCDCGSGEAADVCECDATEPGTVFSGDELQSMGTPCLSRVVPVLASHARVSHSPFYNDLYLAVGLWQFAIWQRDCAFPVFISPPSSVELTCAEWSPSRPSVIITAAKDGIVRLWDLLDSATQPQLCPVTSVPIVSLALCSTYAPMTSHAHKSSQGQVFSVTSAACSPIVCVRPTMQLLAVGDNSGKLHILELSQFARTSNHTDIVLFRRMLRQELRRLRYRRTNGLYTPVVTTHNLTQVLHAIDTLPNNTQTPAGNGLNNLPGATSTTEQQANAAGDEQRWTDADELNEVQYQLMLKEWTAKFAASAEANE